MVATNMSVFLQRSIYRRKTAANSSVGMVGATPYKLFLNVTWVNKQLASSDFTSVQEKRPLMRNIAKSEAGRTS
jgi:hypothetical protein